MKIKSFIRSSALAGVVAALCLTLTVLPLAGCTSQAAIASLTKALGTASANIATLEGNPALSAQLTTDTTAAVAIITDWKNGTPTDNVIEALDVVEADLNLIPVASQYAGLIDIAIATVDSILSLLPVATTPAVSAPAVAHAAVHSRHVNLGYTAPKSSREFKKRWNAEAKANPQLAPALIK